MIRIEFKTMKLFCVLSFFVFTISCVRPDADFYKCSCNQLVIGDTLNVCWDVIDIEPDTVISPYSLKSTTGFATVNFPIDFDGDSINDIEVVASFTSGAASWYGRFWACVKPLLVKVEVASASDAFVALFSVGDTISDDVMWNYSSEINISKHDFDRSPSDFHETRDTVNNTISDKFIVFRKIDDADTVYSHIRVDVKNSHVVTIKEIGTTKKR